MRLAVLMNGVLRGMGHEAPCELITTKTVPPEAGGPVYSHCAIIDAPVDLPDGDYEVEFSGEVAIVQRQDGCWMVASILPHTYQEAAKFYAARRSSSSRNGARQRASASAAEPQEIH